MGQPNTCLAGTNAASCNITQIILSRNICWRSQVSGGVVVDVGEEGIDIENSDRRSRIAFRDQELERSSVREEIVYKLRVLFYFPAHFRNVCWLVPSVFEGGKTKVEFGS